MMPRALLSVYDKNGLDDFAAGLVKLGWKLIASGGTAGHLRRSSLPIIDVSSLTTYPSLLSGRVKTLHPAIHAAILARPTDDDFKELQRFGLEAIDMVVCNLYPFLETIRQPDVTEAQAIEQIDIGGVALLRAAGKNFARVTVICDPADYSSVLKHLQDGREVPPAQRKQLAAKAFRLTTLYDAAISQFLQAVPEKEENAMPVSLDWHAPLVQALRYGENPHQKAAFYSSGGSGPFGGALLHGKELSYNNILDIDAAWKACRAFDEPAVTIVKHLSPCGLAAAEDLVQAYRQALASDPVSAYGGVLALNRTCELPLAEALKEHFLEAIIAPAFSREALDYLSLHKKNCRLVQAPAVLDNPIEARVVPGGILAQTADTGDPAGTEWRVVSRQAPSEEDMQSLRFAWKAVQYVKSNAIVVVKGQATIGIGGGLPSRIDSTHLALTKAGEKTRGAVLASDAFFPFGDSIEAAAAAGITAVVEPGGSIRDDEVIEAADKHGIALIFTGVRHFRH